MLRLAFRPFGGIADPNRNGADSGRRIGAELAIVAVCWGIWRQTRRIEGLHARALSGFTFAAVSRLQGVSLADGDICPCCGLEVEDDGDEMLDDDDGGAFRCSTCGEDWPTEREFEKCPDCLVQTWHAGSRVAMPSEVAHARLREAQFERFYEERQARRDREFSAWMLEVCGPLEGNG